MEVGTQILIERMQSHPEEFIEGRITKWATVWAKGMECLPDEDKEAIKDAHKQMKINDFNASVLSVLAGEQESEVVETLKYKATERYVGGWTDPRVMLEKEMQDRWKQSQKFTAIDEGLKSWRTK